MTIKELIPSLPIRVKLNEKFTLDESFDPDTIVELRSIKDIDIEFDDPCYEIQVAALASDMEHNQKVAVHDWRDFSNPTGGYNLNIYQANHNMIDKNGDFVTTIFVMESDDCFDLVVKSSNKDIINKIYPNLVKNWGESAELLSFNDVLALMEIARKDEIS